MRFSFASLSRIVIATAAAGCLFAAIGWSTAPDLLDNSTTMKLLGSAEGHPFEGVVVTRRDKLVGFTDSTSTAWHYVLGGEEFGPGLVALTTPISRTSVSSLMAPSGGHWRQEDLGFGDEGAMNDVYYVVRFQSPDTAESAYQIGRVPPPIASFLGLLGMFVGGFVGFALQQKARVPKGVDFLATRMLVANVGIVLMLPCAVLAIVSLCQLGVRTFPWALTPPWGPFYLFGIRALTLLGALLLTSSWLAVALNRRWGGR